MTEHKEVKVGSPKKPIIYSDLGNHTVQPEERDKKPSKIQSLEKFFTFLELTTLFAIFTIFMFNAGLIAQGWVYVLFPLAALLAIATTICHFSDNHTQKVKCWIELIATIAITAGVTLAILSALHVIALSAIVVPAIFIGALALKALYNMVMYFKTDDGKQKNIHGDFFIVQMLLILGVGFALIAGNLQMAVLGMVGAGIGVLYIGAPEFRQFLRWCGDKLFSESCFDYSTKGDSDSDNCGEDVIYGSNDLANNSSTLRKSYTSNQQENIQKYQTFFGFADLLVLLAIYTIVKFNAGLMSQGGVHILFGLVACFAVLATGFAYLNYQAEQKSHTSTIKFLAELVPTIAIVAGVLLALVPSLLTLLHLPPTISAIIPPAIFASALTIKALYNLVMFFRSEDDGPTDDASTAHAVAFVIPVLLVLAISFALIKEIHPMAVLGMVAASIEILYMGAPRLGGLIPKDDNRSENDVSDEDSCLPLPSPILSHILSPTVDDDYYSSPPP